jgi:CheY-like chemotaxis protein
LRGRAAKALIAQEFGILNQPLTRILVVEDEDLIREVAVDALRDAGFDVEQAESASVALVMLAKQSFDLLFTDIRMPGMNGIELGRTAQRAYPLLKVMYTSGYTGDLAGEKTLPLLLKPYRLAALIARIEEELATPPAVPSSSTTMMHLMARGEQLRVRLEEERAIGEARRRDVRATVSISSRTRQVVAGLRGSNAESEPSFLAFYSRWLAIPKLAFNPERAAALDIGSAGITLWRQDAGDFECRFSGPDVDRQFGGMFKGRRLATMARFDPVSTSAAYVEVLRTVAPVLIERHLDFGIRNRELVLPLPNLALPYLISAHIFAAA